MPSTRTWLVVLATLIGIVIACAVALNLLYSRATAVGRLPSLSVVLPLRILAMVCIAGAIACIPPLVVRGFVGGQRGIGNAADTRVSWIAQHETHAVVGLWLIWGAGLAIAMPTLIGEMKRAGFTSLTPPADDITPIAPGLTSTVTTPVAGTTLHTALLDAVRKRLGSTSHFKVDHIRAAGTWAFLRATETVPLEAGEEQETDLTVAALLSTNNAGAWEVLEIWTLPGDARLPMTEFRRRLGVFRLSAGLPSALFPDDIVPDTVGVR